jgi:hypothetical protein
VCVCPPSSTALSPNHLTREYQSGMHVILKQLTNQGRPIDNNMASGDLVHKARTLVS